MNLDVGRRRVRRRRGVLRRPGRLGQQGDGWALGLNWYLNENVKWVLNYEHTSFDGGAAGGRDREASRRSSPASHSDSERRSTT